MKTYIRMGSIPMIAHFSTWEELVGIEAEFKSVCEKVGCKYVGMRIVMSPEAKSHYNATLEFTVSAIVQD